MRADDAPLGHMEGGIDDRDPHHNLSGGTESLLFPVFHKIDVSLREREREESNEMESEIEQFPLDPNEKRGDNEPREPPNDPPQ